MIRTLTIVFSVLFTANSLITNPALAVGPETPKQITIEQPQTNSCYAISNQGEDTSASAYYQDQLLFRAASWRGVEGVYYFATPALIDRIEILPFDSDKLHQPPLIRKIPCGQADLYRALSFNTQAIDEKLKTYFNETTDLKIAKQQLTQALPLFGLKHDEYKANTLFELANTEMLLGEITAAKQHFLAATDIYQQLEQEQTEPLIFLRAQAYITNVVALLELEEGKLDRAQALFLSALMLRQELKDTFHVAQIQNNLGILNEQKGATAIAINYYHQALIVYQGNHNVRAALNQQSADQILNSNDPSFHLTQTINTLNNLAVLLEHEGDEHKAEIYWQNILWLAKGSSEKLYIARAQHNFGSMLLGQGRIGEAFHWLQTAMQAFQQLQDPHWYALSLIHLSQAYSFIGKQEKALALIEEAAQQDSLSLITNNELLRTQAKVLLSTGEHKLACAALKSAYESYQAADIPFSSLQLQSEYGYCLGKHKSNNTSKRLQFSAHQGLNERGYNKEAAIAQSRIASIYQVSDPRFAVLLLKDAINKHKKANDLLSQHRTTLKLAKLLQNIQADEFIHFVQQGIAISEKLYEQKLPALWRAEILATNRWLYEQLITHYIQNNQALLAWQASEAIRGRGYLHKAAQLPEHSEHLQKTSAIVTAAFRENQDQEQPNITKLTQLDALNAQQTKPLTHQWQHHINFGEWQTQIQPQELVLSYFIGEESAYLWLITHNDFQFVPLQNHHELETLSTRLHQKLKSPRSAQGSIWSTADQISDILLPNIDQHLSQAKTIYWLADRAIHQIPIALLSYTQNQDRNYLYHTKNLIQATSAYALTADRPDQKPRNDGITIIADPYWELPSGEQPHPPIGISATLIQPASLPGTRTEALAIQSVIQQNKPQLFLGKEANKNALYSAEVKNTSILHIATHGIADNHHESLSALVLASDRSGNPEMLWPHEIRQLDLNAKLVVLSACETAQGRVIHGEGALSLARPFLQSGVEQVIASQWRVNDSRTSSFMTQFYDQLMNEQQSAAEALRTSMHWAAQHPQLAHPHYWAGFVLHKG
jgi:CHAT domain-containing protein